MFRKIFLILLLFLLFKTSFASNLENNYIEIKPGISWYWKLSKPINKNDLNLSYKLYDIDLFDNSKEDIGKLKNKGKIVICYFSAGSWENWREDANKFPNSILGKNLDGWAGEKWLDVSRYNLFSSIMEDRIKLAKQKGCDGVEPDNLDVYDNNSGFGVTKKDSIEYFKFLATTAHKNGLVIALKNSPDIVNDLVDIADFSIVESCNKYNECDRYVPFIKKNKAVLNVEYNLSKNKFCSKNIDLGFSPVKACSSLNGCWDFCGNENQGNNNIAQIDNNSIKKLAPYSYTKFKNILNQCKLTYPDGSKKLVDKGQFAGYKSDVFYADKYGHMIFDLKKTKKTKMRVELRQQQNHKDSGWRIDENKVYTLTAQVKLQKLNKALEYTFLQIHSEVNPLLRLVVKKEKNGKQNHIWAVVRINTNSSGKRTYRYDLGEVLNNYEDFKIEVGNNKLKIYKNRKNYVDKDISYWTEKKNYFKAGIYDSKNSDLGFEIKVMFDQLDMFEGNISSTTNNQNIRVNIRNTKFYFGPYVDSTLYPFPLISDIAKKTGNKNYILAFITSDKGKCNASWGGYYSIDKGPDAWINSKHYYLYDEVNKVKSQGGKIMISFGGQAGIPLFAACSNEDDLVKEYLKVIDKLKIHDLDFDVEGEVLNNNLATEKLIKALVKLQNKYNNKLNIYFTLPVMPEGLTLDGKKLVEKIVKNNLLYAGINLMTMDYGSSYNQDMGDYAIQAVNSTINQLKTIYLNSGVSVSESKLKSILGITPMIGLNDIQSEKFTLEDARQVTQYVKLNGLNRLDYWSLNRDHPCEKNNVSNTCSSKNNQTKDFEYAKTFKNGLGNIIINNNGISNKSGTKIQANNKEKSNNNKYDNGNINQTSNINNIENIANDTKNNKWKEKINNIKMKNKTFNNKKLNKYYPLFIKFFNIKKKKILSNIGYINSKNYNNLNFFANYTFWLFTDLNNKYYKNIKSYVGMLKKVIISLKKVK